MDTKTRIFELLDAKNIEQKAFASQVGVSEGTVSNWRRGVSSSYSRYLVQIAQVLGTTTADLLGETRSVPDSDTLSAADVQVLSAYHAAPAEIRAIVDAALKPYIG
nr:MAG TPA: helix-turn-helix domain protein [Caudoviricetes sp.]